MSLTALPDEVLKLVMQHVPLRDRLTHCCLVNKRLHAAAVAATDQLAVFLSENDDWEQRHAHFVVWNCESTHKLRLGSSQRANSVLPWLSLYGQYVTSLSMLGIPPREHAWFVSSPPPLQQLPCPNLLELILEDCRVQLAPSADGQPGVAQCCSKLTSLCLACTIVDTRVGAVLDSLSSFVHLQRLHVSHACGLIDGLSSATLPNLVNLTYLAVDSLSTENLLQVTNLQVLQSDVRSDSVIGLSSVPGLIFPAPLRYFGVGFRMDPAVLSLDPTGLKSLWYGSLEGGPPEGLSLLSVLARLQQLTRLSLQTTRSDRLIMPPAGPAYSALTASTNLSDLYLDGLGFPAGVWQYVFPPAHMLPHLTRIICHDRTSNDYSVPPSSAWGPADMSRLVSCCPNLRRFVSTLQPGRLVSELRQLTAFTSLHADYSESSLETVAECVQGLAAITRLKQLGCSWGQEILLAPRRPPSAALLSLTKLTALTYLCTNPGAVDPLYVEEDSAEDSEEPAVWLQLLERYAAEPGCQATALRSLAQQLAEQQALSAQQLSAQQQQIADLQQQLATQERVAAQQVADLQQQLVTQQQVAAQRIADLQQELQVLRQRQPQ